MCAEDIMTRKQRRMVVTEFVVGSCFDGGPFESARRSDFVFNGCIKTG